jgi:hypothetical protein
MSQRYNKYLVADVDLSTVRNRVEEHVMACLRTVLEEHDMPEMEQEAIRDIFAFAMNQLPTLYPQRGFSGPDDPVRAWDIDIIVENAFHHITSHPKKH